MKPNLDTLRSEIEHYLEEMGMAVYYGYSRALEATPCTLWDCDQHPDYKQFVHAAKAAGVQLMVFHQLGFSTDQIDDALEQLTACDLPHEEYREFEVQLTNVRAYDGFVCAIELSFDYQGRVFLFNLRADWYKDLCEILDEIQILGGAPDNDDDTPISGYFSRN